MTRRSSTIVLAALLVFPGCLATHNERVRVRRDPPGPSVDERQEQARKEYDENLRLPHEVRYNETYLREGTKSVDRVRATPRDPWASYEADRRAVILQPWGDTGKPSQPEEEAKKKPDDEEAAPAAPAPKKEKNEGEGGEGGDKPADEKKDDAKKDEKKDADKKDDAGKDEMKKDEGKKDE